MKPREQIFNSAVGASILSLPSLVVAQLGCAALLAYLLGAVVATLVALIFAGAGSLVSILCGPYSHRDVALGPPLGFIAAP
jgi:amino acid transporter